MKYLGLIPILLFSAMVVQDMIHRRKFRQTVKELEEINLDEKLTRSKQSSPHDF